MLVWTGAIDRPDAFVVLPPSVRTTSWDPRFASAGTVKTIWYVPTSDRSCVAGIPANDTCAGLPPTVIAAGCVVGAAFEDTVPVATGGAVGPRPVAVMLTESPGCAGFCAEIDLPFESLKVLNSAGA